MGRRPDIWRMLKKGFASTMAQAEGQTSGASGVTLKNGFASRVTLENGYASSTLLSTVSVDRSNRCLSGALQMLDKVMWFWYLDTKKSAA